MKNSNQNDHDIKHSSISCQCLLAYMSQAIKNSEKKKNTTKQQHVFTFYIKKLYVAKGGVTDVPTQGFSLSFTHK